MMGVWMIGLVVLQLLLLFARGPHVDRKTWLGWQGGMGYRDKRAEAMEASELDAEKGAASAAEDKGELWVVEKSAAEPA